MSRTIEEMEKIAKILSADAGNCKLELKHLQEKYTELLEFANEMQRGLIITGYGAATTDAFETWKSKNEQTWNAKPKN